MSIKYSQKQLENLESLSTTAGFKLLVEARADIANQTLIHNSIAKNRDLISKDIIIHETAIEQIRENNGFLKGVDHIINLIESARDRRLKEKNVQKS